MATMIEDPRVPGQQRTFKRMNPVTGEIATESPAVDAATACLAADAAAAAFPAWSALGPNARRAALTKAADGSLPRRTISSPR